MTHCAAPSSIEGAITLLGGSIAGDAILPARHSFLPPAQMAENVLADLGEDVNLKVRSRPILVAGPAFGYGTGRESPARALAAAGVRAIAGGPFGRLFYRNAINNGIVVFELPELAGALEDGAVISIHPEQGLISHMDKTWRCQPIQGIVLEIIRCGGLVGYGRSRLQPQPERGRA